jgi:hypothetical protein
MGKVSVMKVTVLALTLAALLSSCFSLPGIGSINPLAGLQAQASNRVSAEVSSASGLTGLSRKMMFNVMYSQVFFIGGFGANYYDLAETQGTVWRIESFDEDGRKSSVEAERAFLKALPTGERWWYLAWRSEGETWEFEALMDKNLMARKIRYYNADVKRVEEAKFDDPATAKPNSETAPPEEAPASGLSLKDLPKYVDGKETIKIGAGTFKTERIEWDFFDEEEKVAYHYIWWVDPSAAGGLVSFQWSKERSKESIRGELVSLKKGYTTKFSSY